jgi:hypothetical protein
MGCRHCGAWSHGALPTDGAERVSGDAKMVVDLQKTEQA